MHRFVPEFVTKSGQLEGRGKEITLRKATELRVDLEVGAAYVRHGARGERETSVRLSEDVVVHYDADNRVVGIELIEVRPDSIQVAEAFASQNALDFPSLQQYARAPA